MAERQGGMLAPTSLAEDVVLVTGGGTGLGKAIAIELARAGARIVIASRDEAHRMRGVEAVTAIGGVAMETPLDLRRPPTIEAAFEAAEARFGRVTHLVNNAAANFYSPAEDTTLGGWNAVVERVLTGSFLCAQAFARRRIAAREGGSIVNIAATTGIVAGPGVAHSAAAKAGLLNLTRTLAVEWASDRIRVNAVAPGLFFHGDDDPHIAAGRNNTVERATRGIPLGRTGEPREIGWLVSYLCSAYADYLTGETIVLDGGRSLNASVAGTDFVPPREQISQQQALS